MPHNSGSTSEEKRNICLPEFRQLAGKGEISQSQDSITVIQTLYKLDFYLNLGK